MWIPGIFRNLFLSPCSEISYYICWAGSTYSHCVELPFLSSVKKSNRNSLLEFRVFILFLVFLRKNKSTVTLLCLCWKYHRKIYNNNRRDKTSIIQIICRFISCACGINTQIAFAKYGCLGMCYLWADLFSKKKKNLD